LALICAYLSDDEGLLKMFRTIPDKAAELLDYMPSKIEEFINDYKDLTDVFVLGRGTAYPIALEGALKILETNRIRVKGYPISDFSHGPMAQIMPNTLVTVLALKGPLFDDSVDMIKRLNTIGAELIVISDCDDERIKGKHNLRLPDCDGDSVSPFLAAITMQLVAMQLTQVKGIDPDKSDVLKKITVTK